MRLVDGSLGSAKDEWRAEFRSPRDQARHSGAMVQSRL